MKPLLFALALLAALMPGRANADQATFDFDFVSPLFGPPTGNDQQTTLAVDGVNGNDANNGTLYSPKRSLPTTITNPGGVLGLYRGSLFRGSLPLSALGTTHGIVVQDVALGSVKPLPVVSAFDQVVNASVASNGDGTYSCLWAPTDSSIDNTIGGQGYRYDNVYVVEINTATEAVMPVASRRRMVDVRSYSSDSTIAAYTPGSVRIDPPGTGTGQSGSTTQWKATLKPTDGLAPGSGTYRYEVISRMQPAAWGVPTNVGDGAMSGLVLTGSSHGYGSVGAPPGFVGDRLAFVHSTTHNAVIGGGSLQRSVFYEAGNGPSIQLAWYTGQGAGLRWDTRNCLFYANVGDRAANCLIAHTGGTPYDRGDLSDTAFLGARWSDGSLHGTAIDYINVAAGVIERVYVQGVGNPFGIQMPTSIEIRNSVFRQVHLGSVQGNFHNNLVLTESGSDPTSIGNRQPTACLFQQNGTQATNNLFWTRGRSTGLPNDDGVSGIGFYNGTGTRTGCNFARNIVVMNPASTTGAPTYYSPQGSDGSTTMDFNLVINLSKGGLSASVGGPGGQPSWAAYMAYEATQVNPLDQHSMYVDLSTDPRGIQAVFVDPINGDFRWAQTDVAAQCAAFCQTNNVGPATVTTRWPLVPTVDEAVAAITLLPPQITSLGPVTFTKDAYGKYQVTTNLDGMPGAPTLYSLTGQPAWLSVAASSGLLFGTPPQTGNTSLSVSATNRAGTGSALLGITVQTAFAAWQSTYFTAAELNDPAISGPDATPAGDGIANLIKYALGLNPKLDGAGALPTVSFTSVGDAKFLTLTYNKSLAATDVVYTVEVSGDLQAWSAGAGATTTVSTTTNAAGTMQTVVERDLTPTSSGVSRRFIRLKITQP